MDVDFSQSWRAGRASYKPLGATIQPLHYEVAAIDSDNVPRDFLAAHHYAGTSYPVARRRFGLHYLDGTLLGVAVFGVPMNPATFTGLFAGGIDRNLELSRLCLLDDARAPANSESWFVTRCREVLAREGWTGCVTFADPVPRAAIDGAIKHKGHYGAIYRALSCAFLGLSAPRTLRLLPDGTVLSPRTLQKIRRLERGWRGACAQLEDHGAESIGREGDPAEWLRYWLPRITRPLRHGGNVRYAFAIDRRARRYMPAGIAYPRYGFDGGILARKAA